MFKRLKHIIKCRADDDDDCPPRFIKFITKPKTALKILLIILTAVVVILCVLADDTQVVGKSCSYIERFWELF